MTPKKEKLLKEAFEAYIELIMHDFPIDKVEDIVVTDVTGYGTTIDEKITDIKKYRKLVEDQRIQGAGIEIQYNSAPIHRRMSPDEDSAIFLDEFEIIMIIDGEKNIIPLRLSSVFEFIDDKWKLVHFHGSKAVETEGDTWHLEEWKIENEKLKKQVEEKTGHLQQKNRDLEIEAALERVRASSMAMHSSEELSNVAAVLLEQMKLLGGDLYAFGIVLCDKHDNMVEQWHSMGEGEMLTPFLVPVDLDYIHRYRYDQWKAGNQLFSIEIPEDYIAKHFELMFELPSVKAGMKEMSKKGKVIKIPQWEIDYGASFSHGYLLVSSLKPFNETYIFPRFAKVFEQAYTRFLDLQKAEEQVREAQIEAVLERVRSRTMAMQRSEEMPEVANNLFLQVKELGFPAWSAGYCIWEDDTSSALCSMSSEGVIQKSFSLPSIGEGYDFLTPFKKGEQFYVAELGGEDLVEHYNFMRKLPIIGEIIEDFKKKRIELPTFQIFHIVYFKHGYLMFITYEPVPEAHDIFKRLARVFEQTYTRFLDLKKAEEQAREAQIELALERIRAMVANMQNSGELLGIMVKMRTEFVSLGHEAHYFWHMKWEAEKYLKAMTSGDGTQIGMVMELPRKIHGEISSLAAWEKSNRPTVVHVMDVQATLDYVHKMAAWGDFKRVDPNMPTEEDIHHIGGLTYVMARTLHGEIGYSLPGMVPNPPQESLDTLVRFAGVFDLAYRRFEDLRKAEHRHRETQIELALEKVRAKAMAMHNSEDLGLTVDTFFSELKGLNVSPHRCGLGIIDKDTRIVSIQAIDTHPEKESKKTIGNLSLSSHPVLDKIYENWLLQKEYHPVLRGKEISKYYEVMNPQIEFHDFADDEVQYGYYFYFKEGGVFAWTDHELPQRDLEIFRRYSSVLSLTYRRYMDLKDAEAKAREAQIEAALERVRSKTMAMHNSQDVGATVCTLFEEVLKLGLDESIRVGIGILEGYEGMETWSVNSTPDGEVDLRMGMLDMTIHPMLIGLKKAWKSGKTNYSYDYISEDVYRYYEALNREPAYPFRADLDSIPENEYHRSFFYNEGILFSFAPNPISDEAAGVLSRFASVFGQTYRRYLDLQKAEAQARESKIELGLERVRARAMAMQHSNELSELVDTVFIELTKLDFALNMAIINIIDEASMSNTVWAKNTEISDAPESYFMKFEDYPFHHGMFKAWKEQKTKWVYKIKGKEKSDYDDYLFSETEFRRFPEKAQDAMRNTKQYIASFTFSNFGGLQTVGEEELSEGNLDILARFGKVFDLTYTRFNDLKKAEAQAIEAVKQASLDRVRGQIASMRSTKDLQRITPLIWNELETLEVPFNRCGVFIIDEEKSMVRVYLTTPDAKPLGTLNLPIDANDFVLKTVAHWKEQAVFKKHWNKDDFISWTQSMMDMGQVQTQEEYQGDTAPPESLDLHFIPFTQGMLYVGNSEPLSKDKIDLVKSLAKAFSIAYSRYEDFKQLEEAKNKIETTLNDLKATQTQLIQSEKMASLGELTAGIAHEIQNPLNFVNNFSEVSVDLLEEMNEEIDSGNNDEVKEISTDLKQNLEKISHHGIRASSIVKGMLEHSRAGDGQKETIDLNVLADEYLRLAYHGLRAKDKTFNADFKTQLDESLPKIKANSQDIGRVLLNLINNAFFAVSEKNKKGKTGYIPTVLVSTRKVNNNVEILVNDNGNGIPENVLDKIFQPFFTTKPTGQGTGLGLSMSYDIVTKGHGGDLKVSTIDGEGTEFRIILNV